jgi:hypothetical protein
MKTKLLLLAGICLIGIGLKAQTLALPGTNPWIIDDFEGDSAKAVNWVSADGGFKAVVKDPFDPTNKCLMYVRKDGGQIWDGPIRSFNVDDPLAVNLLPSKYQVGNTGLPKYQYVVFRALKKNTTEIVAKVEFKGLTPVQQYGSEHLPNDPAARPGKWQWFIFDLNNKAKSRSGYDLSANNDKNGGYNIFLIQPDRGGNAKDTTYIDDIYFTNTPPVIPIQELKIAGFSALSTDFKVVLKWNKMDVADKYIIKLNGQILATIDDNRIVTKELTYDEAGMQPNIKYAFEIEGRNNAGKTTDGASTAFAYRLKAAEDFSWVVADDFEKNDYKWTRWQDGAHQEYFENPVKGTGNNSNRVLKVVRTPGDSLAYGAKGRSSNSNTFVTFTCKNYFQVPCDSTSTNAEAFRYFHIQMHSPTGNGLPIIKLSNAGAGVVTLEPIASSRKSTWVRDSIFQDPPSGTTLVKSYYYKNSRVPNTWMTFVYKFPKGLTNVNQIELVPDNTFENTKRTQETRNFYVDNMMFSMTADPVIFSALPKTKETSVSKMFVTREQLFFSLKQNEKVNVNIYDISGRKLANLLSSQYIETGMFSVALPQLNSGIYIVELQTTSGKYSLKFSK